MLIVKKKKNMGSYILYIEYYQIDPRAHAQDDNYDL